MSCLKVSSLMRQCVFYRPEVIGNRLTLLLLATWRGERELVLSSLISILSLSFKGLFNCRYLDKVCWRRPVPSPLSMSLTATKRSSTCWELRIKIKALTKINGKRERKALLTVILIADWSEPTHNCPPELSFLL